MKWKSMKDDPPDKDLLFVIAADANFPDEQAISAQYSKERNEFFNIHGSLYLKLEATHWCDMPTYNDLKENDIEENYQYNGPKRPNEKST